MKEKKYNFLGNDDLETKIKTRITTFVRAISSARKEREDEWDKFYKIWKSKEDKGDHSPYKGRARTFAPYGHRSVEVFASRTPEVLFNKDSVVKVVPGTDKTPVGYIQAEANTALLNKQFKKNKQKLKWVQFCRNAAIYGTSIAAINWRFDTREVFFKRKETIPDYDDDGQLIGEKTVTVEQIKEVDMFDAPDMRLVDLKDFFIDPSVKSMDDAPFVVERTRASYNQLLSMSRNGIFNESQVKKLKMDGDREGVAFNTSPVIEQDDRFATTGFASVDFSEKPYEVFEHWGLFEISPGLEVEIVATLVNDVLIRFERNPYFHQKKPYLSSTYIQDDQCFYGLSMLEPVYLSIFMANTIQNQMLDRTTQILNNMWLRSRAANISKEQLKFTPNGIIDTNSMEGLQPLRPNEAYLRDGLQMLEYLDRSCQETTGATKMLAGTETDLLKQSTAFAIKSNKTESTVKFAAILDNILVSAVKPYFEFCQDLNAQFLDAEDTVKILGPEGQMIDMQIRPEDILSEYYMEVYAGDELIQEAYQVQNIISYLNWLLQMIPMWQQLNPGKEMLIPDIPKLAEKVWENMGFKEPMPKVAQQAPTMQQQMLMGQTQQGGGQTNAPVPPASPQPGV